MEGSNNHPTSSPVAFVQYEWAHTALVCASIVSILGSLFVIYSTFRFQPLRKKAFRLIFWLAVSDLGANLATILLYGNDKLCLAQGILVQYFTTAAILWPLVIALTLYGAVNLQGVDDKSTSIVLTFIENPKYVHTFVWGFSGLTTIPPVTTDSYGQAGSWCWIKDDVRATSAPSMERFLCFYILVWLVFIISSLCYCAVYRALRRIVSVNMAGGAQLDIVLRLMNTLKFYPIIFLLSWLPSSIFRLLEDLNAHSLNQPLLVSFFTVFKGSCVQGILDAIAYGYTPAVRKSWHGLFLSLKETCSPRPLFYDSFSQLDSSDEGQRPSHGSRGAISRITLDSSFTKSINEEEGSICTLSHDGDEGTSTLTESLLT